MSNISVQDQQPIDANRISEALAIDSRIWTRFIIDYGVITSVSSDKTKVDVKHAIIGVLTTGQVLAPYETKDVELLYLASSKFSEHFPVAVGDGVLLIGLKDYLPSTLNVQPTQPTDFRHYSQDTLKAIPLSGIPSSSSVQMDIDDSGNYILKNNNSSGNIQFQAQAGLFQIKNAAKSLYTLLNTLEGALAAFMGTAAQAAITSGGASSVSLAAAIVALMTTFSTATATMQADLALLMEA